MMARRGGFKRPDLMVGGWKNRRFDSGQGRGGEGRFCGRGNVEAVMVEITYDGI